MKGSDMKVGATYAVKSRYQREPQKGRLLVKGSRARYLGIGADRLDDEVREHDEIVGEALEGIVVRRVEPYPGINVFAVEPRPAQERTRAAFGMTQLAQGDKIEFTFDQASYRSSEVLGEWDDYHRQQEERAKARERANEERRRRSEANEAKAEELRARIAALGLEGTLNVVTPRSGLAATHVDEPKVYVLDADRLLEAIEHDRREIDKLDEAQVA